MSTKPIPGVSESLRQSPEIDLKTTPSLTGSKQDCKAGSSTQETDKPGLSSINDSGRTGHDTDLHSTGSDSEIDLYGMDHVDRRWPRRGIVLSDRDLRWEIETGGIVFYDPDRDCIQNIGNCSIDVSMGEWYYRYTGDQAYLNPWCSEHIKRYWGEYRTADIVTSDDVETGKSLRYGLRPGDRYISIAPGESILGHTREFIGGRRNITTMMHARSSIGRCNITVCRCAGWGDIGYINRWTMEIQNCSASTVILPVGARIAQIVFFYTGIPESSYRGNYQCSDNLETLVSTWSPSNMLPKLY